MKYEIPLRRLLLLCLFAMTANLAAAQSYTILTWKKTSEQAPWQAVVQALAKKHDANVIVCEKELSEALPALQKNQPRFVAVVGTCDAVNGAFINRFHALMRQIDADPYTDARWGVITGRTADDAMKIVNESKPLTIQRTASGTRIATHMCVEAECFDELIARGHSLKKGDEVAREVPLDADDSIAELAHAFANPATGLIITSGHATSRDWQPGFRYKNGSFHSRDGVIYGRDLKGVEHPVRNDNAKVYLPCGNCLMGLVDGPEAMALAWMHSVGVRQLAGYVEPTWYGYMGWGLMDYFVEQPGRYTFAEAFVANQLALIHRLESATDLSAMDRKGLLFDRDMVAFYGDPAWSAKMADRPLPFAQKLTQSESGILIEITPLQGDNSYAPVDTNGSQRGGRPFVAFLEHRIDPTKYECVTTPSTAVLGDDFVLVPRPASGVKAQSIRMEWKRRK